jgi:hypothetical protein
LRQAERETEFESSPGPRELWAECGKHAADGGKQSEKQSLKLALALVSSGQSLEKMLLMEASTVRSLEEGFLQACKVGDIEAVREVPTIGPADTRNLLPWRLGTGTVPLVCTDSYTDTGTYVFGFLCELTRQLQKAQSLCS